ncbi:NAD(P)-binding protein [Penicillium capsulatum]|uniref:NAD(P)-binding protein n=1 Tax=Penicillium capsulatum TaxID=69766 RepID=A0A9W9IJ65_9EURO|nr:NAD(P)-binding protein [Penicillium capsulatum]KAJ6123403.1 NAD(P)-binding protein [Penicillium capsulatum]
MDGKTRIEDKVLEYTLFQLGLFVDYLTFPRESTKHLRLSETPFDFANRRAIVIDDSDDDRVTLTSVDDLAQVVALAINFEAEWPVVGGIRDSDISIGQLMSLGEKACGDLPFHVEKFKAENLENGNWWTSWLPKADHPAIPREQLEGFSKIGVAGILLDISSNAFTALDEWNPLLPDLSTSSLKWRAFWLQHGAVSLNEVIDKQGREC